MTLVGIDFSLTSPGCCIEKDGELFYYAIQRKENKKTRKLNMLNNVTVEICPKEDLTDFEYYDKISDMLLGWINSTTGTDIVIAMEDWIYSLRGNVLIDIVSATTILRYKLIKKYGEGKLNFYSPTHIKKHATGKGNAKKDDMLFAFNRLRINSPFGQWCHSMSKTEKPTEDIIDSYWIMDTLKKEMQNDVETNNTQTV